jgi:predicted permease
VLLVLLAASALIFVIACSNVANLILARSVRRESELAVRAALGAGTGALRRTLLAESLVLCVSGAVLGVLIARPMVDVLAHYAARFSVRALDMTLDSSLLWVGVGLAIAAALLLAFVPRLPTSDATHGFSLSSGGVRITGSTTRRLRAFAVVQIAASFVLLAGAAMLLKTLLALQSTTPGFNTSVLAVNIPVPGFGRTPEQVRGIYREIQRRITEVPGVERVALGGFVPWRDAGNFGPGFVFTVEGHTQQPGEEDSRGKLRSVTPGFFATLGIPLVGGRDFNDNDKNGAERVVIINRTLADRMFPGQDPLNRHLQWTDPVTKFIGLSNDPRRIVGVVADVNDETIEPAPSMVVYHPADQEFGAGRLFVFARTDPYPLVPTITKIVRDMATDAPVERAATLDDVRAEVLAPNRLNTIVFGGFAAVALAISIVGVAGVLAFSVSGRTREFGIRLAIGSQPRHLLTGVLTEGFVMAALGIVAGVAGGYALATVIASYVQDVQLPSALPLVGSAVLLLAAAVVASVLPAARAARVDVMQALRSE